MITRRYRFTIAEQWEVQADGRTAFVYLLTWPDQTAMQLAWQAFRANVEGLLTATSVIVAHPDAGRSCYTRAYGNTQPGDRHVHKRVS